MAFYTRKMNRLVNRTKPWESIDDFFEYMNKNMIYVVLRSWEELFEKEFICSGKDIDILCGDRKKFIKACIERGAIGKRNTALFNNSVYIKIKNNYIPVDVYEPGDGYYDKSWEVKMLQTRKMKEKQVYILSEENMFYSYLYHVLRHKKQVEEKHRKILEMLKPEIRGMCLQRLLEDYMSRRKYKYTYPLMLAYVNMDDIPRNRIKKSYWFEINGLLTKICNKIQSII